MRPGAELVALARRPHYDLEAALARPGPVIYLEAPRRLGNLGAAIRVAAAADAAAVLTTADPWHPVAVRGAAGLQFAIPVLRVDAPPPGRPLVAVDPGGELRPAPKDAIARVRQRAARAQRASCCNRPTRASASRCGQASRA